MTDCDLSHAQALFSDFSLVVFESCSVESMRMQECQMEAVSPYSTDLSEIIMDDETKATMPDLDDCMESLKGGM